MPFRLLATVMTSTILATTAVHALPADYADRLPAAINDMQLIDSDMVDGSLVAYYGETIGRATLRIEPVIPADPNGAHESEDVRTGTSPTAQRALYQLLDANIEAGTGTLGEGYIFHAPRLITVNVDGDVADAELSCATVQREQAEDAVDEKKNRLKLVDRICVFQEGDVVISTSITTPMNADGDRDEFYQSAHLQFSGYLIGGLIDGGVAQPSE